MTSSVWTRQYVYVAACFLVSGFAALLYETVWLRQFSILLGTSEQALAVVLASYMGGLAVGSLVASKLVDTIRRPLLTYGMLEMGIALSALFVPIGLGLAGRVQVVIFGGNPEPPDAGALAHVVFCLATSSALILLPTALMGATLPMLARHVVHRNEELGSKIGWLYAINTAGAVTGTMIAAFYCLPRLGLGPTTWLGVAANMLVFVIVLGLVRSRDDAQLPVQPDNAPDPPAADAGPVDKKQHKKQRKGRRPGSRKPVRSPREEAADDSRYRWILGFAAFSGAVSFCYEIIFTRMLSHMLGGSVYAFATMLAGFLLGISIGGAVASRVASSRRAAAIGFVYAQAMAAILTLLAYGVVNQMMDWPWETFSESSTTAIQVAASIMGLLPTSICIGLTFPLAIRVYAKDEREAARGSARVYYWNVLGGIVGALATGVWVLPVLQYHGATAAAIVLNILIAVGTVLALRIPVGHVAIAAVALLLLVRSFPTPPENVLRISALSGQPTLGKMLFNHVGKSATVTVFDHVGEIRFQTNGLSEASLTPQGAGEAFRSSAWWLSALPPLVRPSCRSMLIIGLGGGVAVEAVPLSVASIDVVELEPAVVEANRVVADRRDRDPLADPRVRVIINDGRNALSLTSKKYDAIVSQPSHPWTAGASHLYTREFCELVRDHLNPRGIFLQWMNSAFVDAGLSKSMGATLLDVFPHVRLYEPAAGVFLFVASDQPIRPEAVAVAKAGQQTVCDINPVDREYYQRLGVVTPTHLLSRLTLDEAGLRQICEGSAVITDERNLLAMQAPLLLKGHDKQAVESYLDQHSPLFRGLGAMKDLCPSFDLRVYLSTQFQIDEQDWIREIGLPLVDDAAERAVVQTQLQRSSGSTQQWLETLRVRASEFPDNSDLAFQVLSNKVLGKIAVLSEQEESRLRDALSRAHGRLIGLLEQLVAGDLESARAQDAELARCWVDDVSYEMAVRVRLPWRLESAPSERVARCNEVIQIIDQAAPFANSAGLAFFRAAAGMKANRPDVAIGTVESLLRIITHPENEDDADQISQASALSNLARCYQLLRDPRPFQSLPADRYRQVLRSVESVLQENMY